MKIAVIFHSLYGHVWRLAEAIAEGVQEVEGAEVNLYQVPETLPDETLKAMGAIEARKQFAHVPVATLDTLAEADAIIWGIPTRYGNMSAQMKAFIDSTGALWAKGGLYGKAASVFTSTATQHGGQETTILTALTNFIHHGMVLVFPGYGDPEKAANQIEELSGASPYGASTITGGDGSRLPSEKELNFARFQGKRAAEVTKQLIA